jgi:hypothetical protein
VDTRDLPRATASAPFGNATQTDDVKSVSARAPGPTREPRALPNHLTDANFHLLVRDDAAVFDVVFSFSHRGEKCDFICRIAIIDVVWKSRLIA